MKNLISVIIPVHNSENYIADCLHSVTGQTYPQLEILVIDDGSEDNTPALCERIGKDDRRVKIFHQTNQGVSAARNRGLELAEGEFVVFLDSDDLIHPRFLETAMERAAKTGADMVCGRLIKIPSEDMGTESAKYFRDPCPAQWTGIPADRILQHFHEKEEPDLHTVTCKLIRKSLVGALRFDREIRLGEDTLFMYGLVQKGFSLEFNDAPWYLYRMHAGSAMHDRGRMEDPDPHMVHIRIRDSEYRMGRHPYAAVWERRYLLCLKEKFYDARARGRKSVCQRLRRQARQTIRHRGLPGSWLLYLLLFCCPPLFLFGKTVITHIRKKKMLKTFRNLTDILEKKEKQQFLKIFLLNLITPVFDLFSFSAVTLILNAVIQSGRPSSRQLLLLICLGTASFLKSFLELYKNRLQNHFINFGSQKTAVRIFELLQKEELKKHNEKTPSQALAMVREDSLICMETLTGCVSLWTNSAALAGFFIILIYSLKVPGMLVCIGLTACMAIMYQQNRRRMEIFGEKRRESSIRSNAQVTIAFGMFKELRNDKRTSLLLDRYDEISRTYAGIQNAYQNRLHALGILIQDSVMTILPFVLAAILKAGVYSAGLLAQFVVCFSLILRMLPMAAGIVSRRIRITYARRSCDSIRNSLEEYRIMKRQEKREQEKRQKKITLKNGLSVRNMTFGYNDARKIFDSVSVDLPAGKTIAVIGATGAGKTTFLDLMLGLLKPQEGQILYDDFDIVSGTDPEGECHADIGAVVSYIPQTVFLNGETVKNNVAFPEPEKDIDKERVIRCLQCAQVWDEVAAMPQGMDTVIGENGTAISGGQRQRIALARALYKDFEMLVMDEATAALDMETEKAVIDSIRQVKGNKTLLMVTHHMSLADECELLYKIENRKVIRIR